MIGLFIFNHPCLRSQTIRWQDHPDKTFKALFRPDKHLVHSWYGHDDNWGISKKTTTLSPYYQFQLRNVHRTLTFIYIGYKKKEPETVHYLTGYKYACNEQSASQLIGLPNDKLYRQYQNNVFKYDQNSYEIIKRLINYYINKRNNEKRSCFLYAIHL
jgi:hypothetical protein